MKKLMMELVGEFLKDSKRSDRQLAKALKTSQPTLTRMRNKLEEQGLIEQYTIIPAFGKLGFEILAITLTKTKFDPELTERAVKSVNAKPNIIFCAAAEGLGKNGIIISVHKSYADYSSFITEYMVEWRDVMEAYDTVLVSLAGGWVGKPFSLKYMAELLKNDVSQPPH
jgi:DNA-binding Lrp family transcriptional regulator